MIAGKKGGYAESAMLSRRAFLLSAAVLPAFADTRVEIGVCGPIPDFGKAVKYGFDYFEPGAAAIAGLPDGAFADFHKRVLDSPLRCKRFNSFIRTLRVVGPDVQPDALTAYLNSTLDRCSQLGAEVVVWGSAASRNVPAGYARERAWRDIQQFLRLAGDLAQSRHIEIAIEPLRKEESNILNTGAEALRMVREVDHPQVKMIIDYYHMRQENEDAEIIHQAKDAIAHLHFANPSGRKWPKSLDEDSGYARFFELLKSSAYRGGISIEARGSFEEDATASLAFLRSACGAR